MTMITFRAALVAAVMTGGAAFAQTGSTIPPNPPANPNADGLLNRNNLTSTGATVPRPGASDETAPTLTGRSIHDDSDRALRGICKNC